MRNRSFFGRVTLGTRLAALVGRGLLVGCKNYLVSVNEKVVYTPPSIFKDYAIPDQRLFDCVQQTIYDLQITRAEDLVKLTCSNSGITSVTGLEKFFALKELDLSENRLKDISALSKLGRLEILKLESNDIRDAAPLLHLLHLRHLDLQKNPALACEGLAQLAANLDKQGAELRRPAQCAP